MARRAIPLRAAPRPRRQRGLGLIDALAALAVLSLGLLALSRLQAQVLTHGTEAQARLQAAQLADELLNLALLDAANAACYTVPAAGGCASTAAAGLTTAWAAQVAAALPGGSARATLAGGQLQVRLTWRGRAAPGEMAAPTREYSSRTDVRP